MKKTYIVIALDSSGSMGRIKQYALDGYNEQVQQMLKLKREKTNILYVLSHSIKTFLNIIGLCQLQSFN